MLTPIRTIPNLSKHQHTVSLLNGSCSVVNKSLSKEFLYTPLHSQKCMLLIKTTFSTDNSETWLTSTEEIVSKTKYLCWQFLKGVLFPNEHYEKGFQRARFFFAVTVSFGTTFSLDQILGTKAREILFTCQNAFLSQ